MTEDGLLDFDQVGTLAALESFLRAEADRLRRDGGAIGLSGGLDSSVAAALAARALGPERVLGLVMPEKDSHPASRRDAVALAERLSIRHEVVDISPVLARLGVYARPWQRLIPYGLRARLVRRRVEERGRKRGVPSFAEVLGGSLDAGQRDAMARQRCKPRLRMLLLYARAERHNYMVVGTTNRTERLVGFFTRYGDGAADVEPLVALYKTQVRRLAGRLEVPEAITAKAPSSDVVPGITDELRLGLSYEVLDRILCCLERGMDEPEIAETAGARRGTVQYVVKLMRDSAPRREPASVPRLDL